MKVTKQEIKEFLDYNLNVLGPDETSEIEINDNSILFIMREDYGGDPEYTIEIIEGNAEEGYTDLIESYGWLIDDRERLVDTIYKYILRGN